MGSIPVAVPATTTVLVIGGGPGGSYASTVLAREGIDVVLLEAAKHPREHVGESMLPAMRHFLGFIDLEDQYERFVHKPGAAFKFIHGQRECYTDFNALGPRRTTWNVFRAEADEIMIRHAAKQGVQVFEETRVLSLDFENDSDPATARPVSAQWKNKAGQSGTIKFDWLIDASGRQGIMCTKYLKNRIIRESLRNVASYGYWTGVSIFDKGGPRQNAPWFEALTDKTGWAWCIPLHTGQHSIGVVMHENIAKRKKAEGPSGLEDHYLEQVKLVPGIQSLIGENGKYIKGSVTGTTDYSYHATAYSGDHYRVVGDAAAFVDPLFSSGVHVALTGALSAAVTIIGSMKGQVTETEAQAYHDLKIGICQTRFLMIVISAYKQMGAEGNERVLGDLKATDFQHAFDMFRPIMQGEHETELELTAEHLEKMVDFTRNIFLPVSPQQFAKVRQMKGDLVSINAPVLSSEELEEEVKDTDDPDARLVLTRINSLKLLRNDTSPDSFGVEPVTGYVVNLKRGALGLVKTTT